MGKIKEKENTPFRAPSNRISVPLPLPYMGLYWGSTFICIYSFLGELRKSISLKMMTVQYCLESGIQIGQPAYYMVTLDFQIGATINVNTS